MIPECFELVVPNTSKSKSIFDSSEYHKTIGKLRMENVLVYLYIPIESEQDIVLRLHYIPTKTSIDQLKIQVQGLFKDIEDKPKPKFTNVVAVARTNSYDTFSNRYNSKLTNNIEQTKPGAYSLFDSGNNIAFELADSRVPKQVHSTPNLRSLFHTSGLVNDRQPEFDMFQEFDPANVDSINLLGATLAATTFEGEGFSKNLMDGSGFLGYEGGNVWQRKAENGDVFSEKSKLRFEAGEEKNVPGKNIHARTFEPSVGAKTVSRT